MVGAMVIGENDLKEGVTDEVVEEDQEGHSDATIKH